MNMILELYKDIGKDNDNFIQFSCVVLLSLYKTSIYRLGILKVTMYENIIVYIKINVFGKT